MTRLRGFRRVNRPSDRRVASGSGTQKLSPSLGQAAALCQQVRCPQNDHVETGRTSGRPRARLGRSAMPEAGALPPDPAAVEAARRAFAVCHRRRRSSPTRVPRCSGCAGEPVAALATTGCAIHLAGSDGTTGSRPAPTDGARRSPELTFATGEGPRIEALARRRPVLVADLAARGAGGPGSPRRPAGSAWRRCSASRSSSVVSPSACSSSTRPTSTCCRTDEAALALAFVELAIRTALGDEVVRRRRDVGAAGGPARGSPPGAGHGDGRPGVDLAEALVRMRAHAFAQGIPLIDLARAIIDGFVLPPDKPGTSP